MNNDILCSVKSINVIEVTIKRECHDIPSEFSATYSSRECVKVIPKYNIIKQYYNLDGELLAERNVTLENISKIHD